MKYQVDIDQPVLIYGAFFCTILLTEIIELWHEFRFLLGTEIHQDALSGV
jgi:hypothetical protein